MNFTNILNYGIERNCKCNHYKSCQSLQKKKKKRTDKELQNKNKLLRKLPFPSGSDTLVNLQINVLYQHSVF